MFVDVLGVVSVAGLAPFGAEELDWFAGMARIPAWRRHMDWLARPRQLTPNRTANSHPCRYEVYAAPSAISAGVAVALWHGSFSRDAPYCSP